MSVLSNDVETSEVEKELTFEQFEEMYGDKPLRWFQIAARNEVVKHLNDGVKRIVIELPTGAGKTLTFAASMSYQPLREALGIHDERPLRILFIALNHRLLTQAEQTFIGDSNVELILQSAFSEIPESVVKKGWDVTVIDECHHESIASIQYKLEQLGEHPIIGLSATVDRADGTLIKFEKFVAPISRQQAVEEGYLAETDLYSFVDAPEKDKSRIVMDILDTYHDKMKKTLVFMRTKKEARLVTEHLRDLGHSPVFLDTQSPREVEIILNEFSKGTYDFIVNCSKLGEGIDVKGCSSVLLGRTVGSYPLLSQIVGRASRPDSDCNVFEIINPLSGRNLDTTVVVGIPRMHKLIDRKNGKWNEAKFDYVSSNY